MSQEVVDQAAIARTRRFEIVVYLRQGNELIPVFSSAEDFGSEESAIFLRCIRDLIRVYRKPKR